MIRVILITLFFTQISFAQQNVQVVIDGQNYYCSKDYTNPHPNPALECQNHANRIAKKYSVCPKAYPSSEGQCFEDVLVDIKKYKECSEVTDVCYKICPKSYPSNEQKCYQQCYNLM